MKSISKKILLFLATLTVCFAAAEIVTRVMGEFDASGNFMFKNRVIHPHHLPVDMVADLVEELQATDASHVIFDAVLGWAPRPGSVSSNGLYRYNGQGVRSPIVTYSAHPDSGVLRIALFGDSFTHGDDVPYEQTFGAMLEEELNAAGIAAEVLNFGVGGYGIDQAMLRFSTQGIKYHPQVVVYGFQPENLKRNLNLLRPLYDPRTRLPFAKPRFVFNPDGINLINVPVLPPERLATTLENLDEWELLPHEYFYDPADFEGRWWQYSKFLATWADLNSERDEQWLRKRTLYVDNSEEQQLGWAVIQAFAQEVANSGAEFRVLHLPLPMDLRARFATGRFPYQTFLDALDAEYTVVRPEARLIAEVEKSSLSDLYEGHFTAKGNRILAEELFQELVGSR